MAVAYTARMAVLRVVRDVLVILACLAVLWWTYEGVLIQSKMVQIVDEFQHSGTPAVVIPTDVPTPTATGCPFGPGKCGG